MPCRRLHHPCSYLWSRTETTMSSQLVRACNILAWWSVSGAVQVWWGGAGSASTGSASSLMAHSRGGGGEAVVGGHGKRHRQMPEAWAEARDTAGDQALLQLTENAAAWQLAPSGGVGHVAAQGEMRRRASCGAGSAAAQGELAAGGSRYQRSERASPFAALLHTRRG
mmetsp:Transcript_58736/g.116665  ORF Transcript_58736/g.116665 Transcript_58736/m.116665 type:complete len:168 (+) Transcript_58736:612-1115(+)